MKKIAVAYHSGGFDIPWNVTKGVSRTLARMGYRVLDIPINRDNSEVRQLDDALLSDVDAVLFTGGFEFFYDHPVVRRLRDLYKPTAAWYGESLERDDRSWSFDLFKDLADFHFFAARQDAERYGEWLTFGVDQEIFFESTPLPKNYKSAFLGGMYPKRGEFHRHVSDIVQIIPNVTAPNEFVQAQALAEAYRHVDVFVNLPSLSRLHVTKVYEVMSVGTPLVTPVLDHAAIGNMTEFQNGYHLFYYTGANHLREILAMLEGMPSIKEVVGRQGAEEVQKRHLLQHKMETIVTRMGLN
jgi:hypothetical protein